jgi:hypothetical protein
MSLPTVIVAGCARSGLTLTMHMLAAGGFPVVGEFPGFEPYDIGKTPWNECHGKAVKLVDSQLHLPPPGDYMVIECQRDNVEQAKSTAKFLRALGFQLPIDQEALRRSIDSDKLTIAKWTASQPRVMYQQFEEAVTKPLTAARNLRDFLKANLDIEAMARAVVPRGPKCCKELIEARWL